MFFSKSYKLSKETLDTLKQIKLTLDSRYTANELNDFFTFNDGQTPEQRTLEGQTIMLWWLTKYNPDSKRELPSYFYFKYGISFVEQVKILNKKGLLNQFEVTEKGKKFIEKHQDIIEQHKDPDGIKRRAKNDIKNHIDIDINLSDVTLVNYDESLDASFDKGSRLFRMAEQLSKEKQYERSLKAIFEAWSVGYQMPVTFQRAAINARYLKNYEMEIAILKLALQSETLTHGKQIDEDNWIKQRIERASQLARKNV